MSDRPQTPPFLDQLEEARKFLDSPVGESNPNVPLVLSILGAGQQLSRIADVLESMDYEYRERTR